jgi:hypothetical protein
MSRKANTNNVASVLASEEKKLLDELAKLEKQIYVCAILRISASNVLALGNFLS